MDTNLNRDFTTWTSMRDVTINGAPVTNKNVLVDGISIVDEGGAGNAFVNPNIDAVGEVQVIANGFTAENGRNNGGLINMVTKSGTNTFKGSGWYNARRDRWNENDYLRRGPGPAQAALRGEHHRLQHRRTGGHAEAVRQPHSNEEGLFLRLAGVHRRRAAVERVRANLPTELERHGDFSQTRQTNGAILPIIDPLTGQPFPGNIDPGQTGSTRWGQKLLGPAAAIRTAT